MRLGRDPYWRRNGAAIGLVLVLSACAGKDYARPDVALGDRFRNDRPSAAPDTDIDPSWWRSFDDPALAALIEAGLRDNPDVAIALARFDQAAALVDGARARLLPEIGVGAGAAIERRSEASAIGIIASRVPGFDRTQKQYSLTAAASWEIDLFGRLSARRRAAVAEAEAASAAVGGTRLSIAAEIANGWFTLGEVVARRDIARRRLLALEELRRVVGLRHERGIAARIDVDQVDAELAGAKAGLANLDLAVETAHQALGLLTGGDQARDRQPAPHAVPSPVAARAPVELLRRRPDIVAAERAIIAANARQAAALADPWPRLTLGGLIGLVSTTLSALPTSEALLTSGSAGFSASLFDFGRAEALANQARGQEREAIAAYRKTVLAAVAETEIALAATLAAERDREATAESLAALERVHRAAGSAYRSGAISLVELLDAERRLLAAEDRRAAVNAAQARAAVTLFRVFGGGWSSDMLRESNGK